MAKSDRNHLFQPQNDSFFTIFPPNIRHFQKTTLYRVTRAPKRVENIAVEKIEIVDEGQANIDLSWAWPEDSYWGSVKIDYSPYTPTGQPSPFYISDRRVQAKIPMESAENRKFPRNSTDFHEKSRKKSKKFEKNEF